MSFLSNVRPIKDDLPSFPSTHGLEALLIIAPGKTVRDDRRNVQAGFDHDGHLVPGLKHFAAVDALDRQHVEDDGSSRWPARRTEFPASRSCRRGTYFPAFRGTLPV